jgi:hypothetical protein
MAIKEVNMSIRTVVLLSLSAILVGSAATAIVTNPAPLVTLTSRSALVSKIPGGKTYKSPNHIFTIVVPAPTGFDHSGWEVAYESKNGDHEMVTFAIYDFAETFRAGIAETAGSPTELDTLAHAAAASRKHQIGLPLESIEETKVNTQFGKGSLRVYSMKGGSLDMSGHMGEKPQFHDSYIAVLLVPHEGRTLYAVAQDDCLGLIRKVGDEAWKKSLKDEVQSFFATMTLGK